MSTRNSPPLLDLPRFLIEDKALIIERLLEFWNKKPAMWNYLPVIGATPVIINHCTSREQAMSTCSKGGAAGGVAPNMDAAGALFDLYKDDRVRVYEPPGLRLKRLILRRTPIVQTLVRPSGVLVRGSEASILLLQARKDHERSVDEWSMLIWLVQRPYATGEHARMPIEFPDLSANGAKDRVPRIRHSSEFPAMETREASKLAQVFLSALDEALKIAPKDDRTRKSPRSGEGLPLFPWL